MGQFVRSARGEMIDFELLAIKQQLASAPVPKAVEERKIAIAIKDGVKTDVIPDLEIIVEEPSEPQEAGAGQAKQIKRK